MSGQSGGYRLRLSKLNEQLTCKLCGGYFIDATTIIECLHSFCRSCIVKYLENNKYCPICEVQVHKSRPLLNIRPDYTLQDIVYKLVPGCYQNEMRCRREFYLKHPDARNQAMSPEARGEPIESHIYSPDESLSLSLEYFNPHPKDINEANVMEPVEKQLPRRYLRCPAAVTVFHLQKLIRAKYGLSDAHRVDIMYKEEPLCSSYTLMDVMYIYHWRRKVPLHLSYRIFESSPKRMKLSEDNASYKKSLSNAGIDTIESKDEQSVKREWKEVQLKISETGVMSVTDISSPESKRATRVENLKEQKSLETSVTTVDTVNKSDPLLENTDSNKLLGEIVQTTLNVNTHLTNNSTIILGSNNTSIEITDLNSETEKNSLRISNASSKEQQDGKAATKSLNETLNPNAVTKDQHKTQETEDHITNNNSESKLTSQTQISMQSQKIIQNPEVFKMNTDSVEDVNMESKQQSTNNNNITTESKADCQKQSMKGNNETKTINAGSKIDALSAKLQFQPKICQVNNTYSKKAPKEKRTILHSLKKSDTKVSENLKSGDTRNTVENDNVKTRTNCNISTTKTTVPCTVSVSQQKPTSTIATQQNSFMVSSPMTYVTTSTVSLPSEKETVSGKTTPIQWNPSTTVNVHQALNLLEQRITSPERASIEAVPRTSHTTSTTSQKLQYARSNNTPQSSSENNVSIGLNVTTSTMSQSTTTFPYTVQDLVSNAMLKSPLKNSSSCSSQKMPPANQGTTCNTTVSCTASDSQVCSVPQFNVQTPSMSIYSISTSHKSTYSNTSQNVHTTTTAARQTVSRPNFESSNAYSVPPCPDAIPISLMKPIIRKHEIIAKGTNLNEICAKIGTSGSKINDICAKIGENTKEKNKSEARNKSDIPDLLKIAKKSPSPSSGLDSTIKHIPNIPNVPIYTPSNSITASENKTIYTNVKDSAKTTLQSSMSSPVLTSHGTQKISSTKKQSQPIGYKTLRDPPKSWNPTLSKNNYVAVKNQAKEMQNQTQSTTSEGTSKPIQSKPAKIFKMRNMPRYLGNPASGVKRMYGITNDAKEKEQSANNTKGTTLNMMKIDPKTLSPIVSTVNSPIVSPPPYSPNARSYQNTPFPRDMCRNTGSPISPRNSPVNMLSTNPFIPSPTPNTNPRLIYSHYPPPFPDASRFPNPLIRSPIGIPPPSAFHSSLPPSINKLYQRSSYIPQTTGYSSVSQPPTVQRIPPSTHSSSPKSPKTSSPSSITVPFNTSKSETQQSPATSVENVTVHFSKPSSQQQQELNAFNLSKTGTSTSTASDFSKVSTADTTTSEAQDSKQTSPPKSTCTTLTSQSKQNSTSVNVTKSKSHSDALNIVDSSSSNNEHKQRKETDYQKESTARCKEDNVNCSKAKIVDGRRGTETKDSTNQAEKDKVDKVTPKVNGDVTTDHFSGTEKSKDIEDNDKRISEKNEETERSCVREQTNAAKISITQGNTLTEKISEVSQSEPKSEDLGKVGEQIQGKKSEAQRNKAES